MSAVYTSPAPVWARWLPGTQALRTCLVLALVGSALAAVWSWPADATAGEFLGAYNGGEVRAVQLGQRESSGFGWSVDSATYRGSIFWQDSSHRTHETQRDTSTDAALGLRADLADRDDLSTLALRAGVHPVVEQPLLAIGRLALFVALIALVRATSLQRATKWAWFWAGAVAPLGTGALLWLAVDSPWSRRAPMRSDQLPGAATPQQRRVGGGLAFCLALLAQLLGLGALGNR